ncbi:Inorganic polyphosphate/ATP-NAD kinase predicted [Macrophomina phaseolina MS6]|uniref:Inorganic polyphosphate/ATP-NAD kinase predicted n=1 Tax=Macrophomina phaseolina (strain MS6) TaxID=1126212 RepID=K2RTU2_MACPH|nr:Inorganic polyphosphate/ATP-NAD kinase predicted [Macrophomina phaseolina MS6]
MAVADSSPGSASPQPLSIHDALAHPSRDPASHHGLLYRASSPSPSPRRKPAARLRSVSTPAVHHPLQSPRPAPSGDSLAGGDQPATSPLISPSLEVSGQTPTATASLSFLQDASECPTPVAASTRLSPPSHLHERDDDRPHKSFRERRHRKNAVSIDSVPRQTIMKALASRPPPTSNMSIASSISGLLQNNREQQDQQQARPALSRKRLSGGIADLTLNPECLTASKITALASPCFFHKKFDAAVNIDKVLEEIREDDGMSHSRLLQTATGVREVSKQLQRRPVKIAVKNVMIVTKARDNQLVDLTRELADWLLSTPRHGRDVGVNVYVDHKLRNSRRFDAQSLLAKDERFGSMLRYWTPELCLSMPEKFDLVLTLGGDGTVLYTSWLFQRIVPPILSFSLGSLGFLTNFEFNSYKEQLSRVMGDAGMRVNLRMRFTCTVYRANPNHDASDPESPAHLEAEQYEVLNELVIDRGPSPYVSNLELYGDNELLTIVQADGCIFSTPTGSTAYSLSAGGSLVHPDIPAILLTPICPHTLSFRPMLLNDSMLLRVAVPRNSRATAYCAFDGKGRVELRQGDHVTIAASQYPFPTVLSRPTEWFDSLGRTLRWNTRGAQQKAWDAGDEKGEAGEEKFDIDIDDDDPGRDSGYSAATSSAGNGSPVRRGSGFWGI